MARIAVVTSSPPFVEGGHLVLARALAQALREAGHQSEILITPQNRFGRQGAAYLATYLTDVGRGQDDQPIDQVISLRFPSYAVRHPVQCAGSTTRCASTTTSGRLSGPGSAGAVG